MNKFHNELLLKPFQPVITIDFGDVIIGRSEINVLFLKNDFDFDQEFVILKNPGSPFTVSFKENIVEACSSCKIEITWSPILLGNAFEKIIFKVDKIQLQVKVLGTAIEPIIINKKISGEKIIQKLSGSKVKRKLNIEDKENILSKPIKTIQTTSEKVNIFPEPIKNSIISTNTFNYDDLWLKDQENCFVEWLNHIFATQKTKTNIKDLYQNIIIYKEAAKALFQNVTVLRNINKIDTEISRDSISIKSELLFRQNTVVHTELTNLIMNYNKTWLLISLDIIFDQDLSAGFQSTNIDLYLKKFISNKILWNSCLAQKYSLKSSTLYSKKEFDKELHRHILKRFFTLVYFLDVAKHENILPEDVNLFRKSSIIKSSTEMVTKFTSAFIKSEGAIVKRLNNWGCKISYVQTAVDDFDFTVTNLSEDIGDGVRLAKLAKILIGVDVLDLLRLPAIDLSRKLFNINLAVNAFKQIGTDIITYSGEEIDISQIPLGHREKTLALLWCILSRHYIDAVIDRCKIIQEVKRLGEAVPLEVSSQELLLLWARVIGKIYNMDIVDFSNFFDGRALCFLIHHYLPEKLKLSEIHHQTTLTTTNGSLISEDILVGNERENFRTFCDKLKEIGGAPITMSEGQAPTIEVIQATLAFFSSRLIDLMELYKAAHCIQRVWKKYKSTYKFLSYYKKYERDVIIVQSYVRRYLCRKTFKIDLSKIVKCQSVVKQYIVQKKFKELKKAVCLIQKVYRGYRSFKDYKEIRNAVIKIQANYRRYMGRKNYLIVYQSTLVIQKFVRGYLARCKYQKFYRSIVIIQSHVRGYIIHKRYTKMISAANKIKAIFRGYVVRKWFINQLNSIIIVQSCIRRFQVQRRYKEKKIATITIQKNVKKFLDRRRFQKIVSSTIVIQKYFRGFLYKRNYKRKTEAVRILQRHFLGYLQRRRFLELKQASILVQKNVRMRLAMKDFSRKIQSITIIQKYVKGYLVRKKFQNLKSSVIIVQKYIRGFIAKRLYKKIHSSVVFIQRCVRGYLVRKSMAHRNQAAIIIQKNFKSYISRKWFVKQKNSVIKIQKYVRGYWARYFYKRKIESVIIMQSFVRKVIARRKYVRLLQSVIVIQKNIRRYFSQKLYNNIYQSIIVIQKTYKMYYQRNNFLQLKKSVILIQKHTRRLFQQRKFMKIKTAAISIQKHVRGYQVRKQMGKERKAAIFIQKWYRGFIHRKRFLVFKQGAIVIQKYFRGYLQRCQFLKSIQSICLIQSFVRMYIVRRIFQRKKQAIITLQRHVKGYLGRRKFFICKHSTLLVQKNIRRFIERKRFLMIKKSVVTIQKYVRGYLDRSKYKKTLSSSILIQKYIRGYLVRQYIRKQHQAATIIQHFYWSYTIRCHFICQKNAVTTIQKYFRAFSVRRKFFKVKRSAIIIQKYTRGFLARKKFNKIRTSAILIQKTVRSYLAHKNWLKIRSSAILIQSQVRRFLLRKEYKRKLSAVLKIQSFVRKVFVRRSYIELREAIVLIQKNFRLYLARKTYLLQRKAVVIIQKVVRGFIIRKRFFALKNASTVVAKYRRGLVAKRYFQLNKYSMQAAKEATLRRREQASIIIQAKYRSYVIRKQFLTLKNVVVFLQRRWRFFIQLRIKAVVVIQRFWRHVRKTRAAINIQRIWRGKQVRQKLKNKKIGQEIGEIRTRFVEANRRFSKYNTIRYIGVKALVDLMKPNCTVAKILSCLSSLEKVTSLSREICKWLSESDAYQILIELIHDCNRGVADLEVVAKSISVLFNLARAHVLNLEIIGSEVGTFLKDLLLRNIYAKRGTKGVAIFCHACLLWVLLIKMETDTTSSFSIAKEPNSKPSLLELKQSIQIRYNNTNSYLTSEKLEQMRLNPSWDLRRPSNIEMSNIHKKKDSTTSLQNVKSKPGVALNRDNFKKPLSIPLAKKAVNNTTNYMRRSLSVSNNLQKVGNSRNPTRPTNIFDISHQLYAIDLLINTLDS